MSTDTTKPRQKRNPAPILTAVVLLAAMGGTGLYLLGKEDPRDTASAKLAWGDRVERRLDAFIDRVRPGWADHVEARLDAFASRVGWN